MANVLAELFQNTANAIREKTGEAGKIKPLEFPEKIRSIQMGTGGTEPNLIPLSVTKNGKYYPVESVELGGTYTFKNSYTQEELQTMFNTSVMGGIIFLIGENEDSGAVINNDGGICILQAITDGNIYGYLPDVTLPELGEFTEGWYYVNNETESFDPVDKAPSIHLAEENFLLGTNDISDLNALFELNEADGFSEVTVEVPQEPSEPTAPNLIPLSVTENGVYVPSEADGYSKVTVNIQGSALTGAHTLKFLNHDGALLYEKQTVDGDDSYDPVEAGKIERPTKESTAVYDFQYYGWALSVGGAANNNALSGIKEDKTLYAAFLSQARKYTVRFWDGSTLLSEQQVAYGMQATPPDISPKDGYTFLGWNTDNFMIYGESDFYTRWEELSGWVVLDKDPNFTDAALSQVAYNNAGTQLAVSDYTNKKLIVYNSVSYPYQKLFEIDTSEKGNILLLCYSYTDKYLYAHGTGGAIVYDTSTSPYTVVASEAKSTSSSPKSANFIPNTEDFLITNNSVTMDGNTRRMVKTLGSPVTTYGSKRYGIYPNASSVDVAGTKIASCYFKSGNTDGVAVYSLAGVRDSACPAIAASGSFCTFDPSGRYLLFVVAYSNTVRCYDTSTNPYTEIDTAEIAGETLNVYADNSYFFTSKNKEYLFLLDPNHRLQVYDMRTIPFRHVQDFPEIYGPIAKITVTPDLKKVMILQKTNTTDYTIISNV